MADAPTPAIQECATCGTLIDVTDEQPFALRHCPNCGAAMRVRRTFNHFELQEILGTGGMGAVYRAMDTNLHRPVALKLLRAEHSQSPELIESFAKEAALTASINHPHVVKVYSTGTDHGIFYIAMELVDKGSLDDLMTLQGKVAESQVLEVGIQIAQGLNAASQRGLIHRDVKPGNILFADAHNAKIVDFGLAVLQEHANTDGDAPVWGTPYYVAPEKLEHTPREDFRSDMYSLGATLFHALAGRPPFEAETVSMVTLKHLKSQAVHLQSFAPEVSSATAYVINKTLSKDPDQRFASYEELIENLQYARGELLGTPYSQRRKEPAAAKKSTGWITVLAAALTVAAGMGWHQYQEHVHRSSLAEATPSPQAAARVLDETYKAARELIAAGSFTEAAAVLRALEAKDAAPQPLRNWINMNAALAFFLAGQPDDAKQELKKVEERGIFSPDPSEQKIATFFMDTAKLAGADGPNAEPAAKNFDRGNYECFALMLLGAKDWELGALDEAGALFEQFQAATPDEAAAWLDTYKPIASARVADLGSYRALAEKARTAQDSDALKKAVEEARAAREKQKQSGKLADKLAEVESALSGKLAAAEEARTMKEAAQETAETKALADALARVHAAFTAFKFADAQPILAGVNVTDEKRKAERDMWAKRAEWLARFKATLVNDINIVHYTQPLRRTNGTTIPFGLGKASDARAEMVTPYGDVPVTWTEISSDSIIAMAQAFLRAAQGDNASDRRWQLGVYLYTFGKKTEALALLRQAAEAKADYQPFIELFPEA